MKVVYHYIMRTCLALLVSSFAMAQDAPPKYVLEDDGYLAAYKNDTRYWNENRAKCTLQTYSAGVTLRALASLFYVGSEGKSTVRSEVSGYPDAVGIRVYYYHRTSVLDSRGNATVVFPNIIMVDIPLSHLSEMNPNFAQDAIPVDPSLLFGVQRSDSDALSLDELGYSMERTCDEPKRDMQPVVDVFIANGGRLLFNPDSLRVRYAGAEALPE